MASASLRAYLDGPETTAARHQIVVDYLNSTPLSARAGLGEINGLGDGLWGWFGTDFALASRVLHEPAQSPEALATKGRIYKQVLSLLLAQRRPSYYLVAGRAELARLTDSYLRLMRAGGAIDAALAQSALAAELEFLAAPPAPAALPYADRKAANAIRTELLTLLGLPSLYRLDRLDLAVETSLDLPTQRARERPSAAAERSGGGAGARPLRPPPARSRHAEPSPDHQPDALRARRRGQLPAGPGRQSRAAVRHEPGRQARSRLDREAADPDHLSRDRGRAPSALRRAAGERAQGERRERRRPLDPVGGRPSRRERRAQPAGAARRGDGSGATRRAPGRASSPAAGCTASRTSTPSTTARASASPRRSATRSTSCSSG